MDMLFPVIRKCGTASPPSCKKERAMPTWHMEAQAEMSDLQRFLTRVLG
jgi:hypothetical protein